MSAVLPAAAVDTSAAMVGMPQLPTACALPSSKPEALPTMAKSPEQACWASAKLVPESLPSSKGWTLIWRPQMPPVLFT